MRGNASILWSSPPQLELVPTPDPEVDIGALSDGEWNGSLLRVIEFSEVALTVVPSFYGHLAAARRGDGTGEPLFLAVTGVTRIGEGFVLGKRANDVTDGGLWEFAPSGGVQRLPIEHQILTEATEELGVSVDSLSVGSPVALYVDSIEFTADLIIPLRVNLTLTEFLSTFVPGEYERVEVVHAGQVETFLSRNSAELSAVTRFIVALIDEGKLGIFPQ
jgi:hypothetical protein